MKIDELKTKHESDRITIVLGIIATYIALFSAKDVLPFDMSILFDTSGYILLYLAGYLVMTAFCYRHDNTYTEYLARDMDLLRKQYYDVGTLVLPLVFFNVAVWSLSDNAWIRTIGILATSLYFVIRAYRGLRHRKKRK